MIELNQKYDRDQLLNFLREVFLSDFQKDIRPVGAGSLSAISKAHTLGSSPSLDLQVFEFEYSGSFNKRIALAKEAFQVMKQSATFQALAVFYSPENNDWRFSLMTANPQRNDQGNISVAYSNPRRYSFFLGPNAKVNTPNKFLIKKGAVVDFNDLKSRFSLEVVNKEFYKEISESFTKLVGGTRGEGKNKKTYESLLRLPSVTDHSQTSIEFAVRLIGRIIFCWFLREKISKSGSPLMPKGLFSFDAIASNFDYYHKILEPIFFEILNKPIKSRKDPYSTEPFSLIPYLNGGLFSPHGDDFFSYNEGKRDQYHNTVVVPDEWIKEFFSILETYNFTIDENTSIDEELSIDPEMLGRIFENLLAEINPETGESARKSTGSYYTPRMIVDYMVDESLLLYLKQHTNINEDKLRAIISYDLSDDSTYPLHEDEKIELVDAIEKVKILDPACGSGAYPIGALQKIVFILQQVDPDGHFWFQKQIQHTSPEIRRVIEREFSHKNFDYIRKLGVIRENIYGIDIQPIATEIARLRCFLTLVVDERIDDSNENRGIEPLPNLDFKFVTANSLIGLPGSDKKNQMGLFEDTEGINELREIRDMFFNASGTEREQLKLQFVQSQNKMFQRLISENRRGHAELTTMLTTWDPFSHKASSWFDPEWMFGIKEGFDIVIANPPYIQLSKTDISKETKQHLLEQYKTSSGRYNTFGFFILKGINIVKLHGILTYIIPNTLLTQEYYQYIRKYILENSHIHEIVNYDEMIFESAVVENITILIQKEPINSTLGNLITKISTQNGQNVDTIKKINQNNYYSTYKNQFDIKGDDLTKKIETLDNATSLSSICNINQAIALKGDRSKSLLDSPDKGKETYRLLDGRNIQKYCINWQGVYLDYDVSKIHSCKRKDIFLQNEKLFFRRVSSSLVFAYDNEQFFALNTLVAVSIKENSTGKYYLKYLLALLNSKLVNYYYFHKYKSTKNVFSEIQARSIGLIPIPTISLLKQRELVETVDNILSITKKYEYTNNESKNAQIQEYENQIDRIVYVLYGFTESEIELIEGTK